MIKIEIPGKGIFEIQHLLLDYNGTIASDGKLIQGLEDVLYQMATVISVHVITADTFGTCLSNLNGLPLTIKIIGSSRQDIQKLDYLNKIGAKHTVCVGNGFNDHLMLKNSAIGILVINTEGASATALANADIVCRSSKEALELLLNPQRITATLRN